MGVPQPLSNDGHAEDSPGLAEISKKESSSSRLGGARQTVTCDVCGEDGAHERTATRTFGRGSDMFVVEAIPYVQCPNCGERYFTARTLIELENTKP